MVKLGMITQMYLNPNSDKPTFFMTGMSLDSVGECYQLDQAMSLGISGSKVMAKKT